MPDPDSYEDRFSQEKTVSDDQAAPKKEETVMPKASDAAPVSDGNDKFPMSCKRFIATLVHTEYEVYGKLLLMQHGRENHTDDEWLALIGVHAAKSAHPSL